MKQWIEALLQEYYTAKISEALDTVAKAPHRPYIPLMASENFEFEAAIGVFPTGVDSAPIDCNGDTLNEVITDMVSYLTEQDHVIKEITFETSNWGTSKIDIECAHQGILYTCAIFAHPKD